MRIIGIANVGISHTEKWANYFSRRGHQVHLVSFEGYPRNAAARYAPGVTIDHWVIPPFHIKHAWMTLRAVRHLRRAILKFRPDLVQVHFLGPGAWYAALAGGAPLSVWVMGGGDVIGTVWRPTSTRESLLTPLAVRRSRLVLAWSRNLLESIRPMVRTKVPLEVVVGGVDTSLFQRRSDGGTLRAKLGLPAGSFSVLSCRLLWPRQNITVLLRAMPDLLKRQPQACLLLMTYRSEQAPEYRRLLESEIDRLSLRNCIRLIPEVPNEQMPAYLSAVDCVVSIPDTDGTPMTVMEAAACGTPAVIHDLPDYDPAVFVHEKTVLRVPLRDPQGLAEALLRIADEGPLRDTLRQGGLRMVYKHANYETEMARLEQLYSELMRAEA
jgi:L-malate glycosyltransferase